MVYFCKSGLMILKDSDGDLYYFNPRLSLREVAEYVWSKDSLCEFQTEINPDEKKEHNVNYIDSTEQGVHRLRSLSPLMDDKYYTDL